jgi:hypothetical protein
MSNIPNATNKWTLCSLNPDRITSTNSITQYLGYTSSLRDTYLLIILITFVLAFVIIHYATKIKNKK